MLSLKEFVLDTMVIGGGFRSLPPFHQPVKTEMSSGKIIILIHGLLGNWWDMYPIYKYLSIQGFNVYYLKNLGLNVSPVEIQAAKLIEFLDRENLGNVTLIAHSKGGLIGKYAMAFLDETRRINKLIAIATPFNGITLSKYVPIFLFEEINPDSDLIRELLHQREINKRIVTISAAHDNWVGDSSVCCLEGAENITLPITGHHRVLYSQKTLELIEKILTLSL